MRAFQGLVRIRGLTAPLRIHALRTQPLHFLFRFHLSAPTVSSREITDHPALVDLEARSIAAHFMTATP